MATVNGINVETQKRIAAMLANIAENCDAIRELCGASIDDAEGRGLTYAVAARELAALTGWLADTATGMMEGSGPRLMSSDSWLLPPFARVSAAVNSAPGQN